MIQFVGVVGTEIAPHTGGGASAESIAITLDEEVPAGSVVVVRAVSQAVTADDTTPAPHAESSIHTSCLDNGPGLVWEKIIEWEIARPSSDNRPGIILSKWWVDVTETLPAGTVITVSLSAARYARLGSAVRYDRENPGSTVTMVGAAATGYGLDAGGDSSILLDGLAADNYRWLGTGSTNGATFGFGAPVPALASAWEWDQDTLQNEGDNGLGATLWGQHRGIAGSEQEWAGSLDDIGERRLFALCAFLEGPAPEPPPDYPEGWREYQADFETAEHEVEDASVTQYPDGISMDHRRASAPGPAGFGNIALGQVSYRWQAEYRDGAIWVRRSNAAITAWGDWSEWFTVTGAEVSNLSLAFTAGGVPVLVAERPTGAGGSAEVWMHYGSWALLTAGRTPRVVSLHFDGDGPSCTPPGAVTVELFYLHPTGCLRRTSSDSFGTAYPTLLGTLANRYLHKCVLTTTRRLVVVWGDRSAVTGQWVHCKMVSTPHPSFLTAPQLLVNLADTANILYLRGELYRRETPGTDGFYVPVTTPIDVTGLELQTAGGFPSGYQPNAGGIWDPGTIYAPGGGVAAEGGYNFPVVISWGASGPSTRAFRVRSFVDPAGGGDRCYSPWVYFLSLPEETYIAPTYEEYQCGRWVGVTAGPGEIIVNNGFDPAPLGENILGGGDFGCDGEIAPETFTTTGGGRFLVHQQTLVVSTLPNAWYGSWAHRQRTGVGEVPPGFWDDLNDSMLGGGLGRVVGSAGGTSPYIPNWPDAGDQTPLDQSNHDPQWAGEWESACAEPGNPIFHALPSARVGRWYEPDPLPAGGAVLPHTGFRYGTAVYGVRGTRATVQVTLAELGVFDTAFLDNFLLTPVASPCSLRLRVFEDDRVTVRWEVSTDPLHEAPYLMQPEGYAEQALDLAAGAATIGTVSIGVVDFPTQAGDQDSGLMTGRLASSALADIHGRRCVLDRFISESLPYVVLADGPGSAVRMHSSFAAFLLTIRDTRETERRLRLTGGGGDLSLLPWGPRNGYGYDPAGATYLLDPAGGVYGTFAEGGIDPMLFLPFDPENPLGPRRVGSIDLAGNALTRVLVPLDAWRESGGINTISGTGLSDDGGSPPESIPGAHEVYWRPFGSGGAWTKVEQPYVWGGTAICGGIFGPCPYEFYPNADEPTSVRVNYFTFSGTEASMPADTDEIEVQIIVGRGGVSEALPFYLEGVAAGELIRRVYDGEMSPRDERGEPIPTGIRYDAAAVAALTDVVRLRLTDTIDDLRGWLEKHIYAPLGYVAALDLQGRISPMSQIPPENLDGLPVLQDAIVEPAPDWDSGDRIINVVRVTYPRDYKPGLGPTYGPYPLEERAVVVEFRDEASIQLRHNEHVIEIDGEAFRAIGVRSGEALAAGKEAETGHQIGVLRGHYLLDRYSLGAPTLRVRALRAEVPTARAGSWVAVDLSYLPDYVTGRRGLVGLGQVVAVSEVDCFWRSFLVELVPFTPPPSS